MGEERVEGLVMAAAQVMEVVEMEVEVEVVVVAAGGAMAGKSLFHCNRVAKEARRHTSQHCSCLRSPSRQSDFSQCRMCRI
jgi:hypothetical protein